MEDKWLGLLAIAAVAAFFGLMGLAVWIGHVETMECMKLKGEHIKGVCVFREQK